MDRRDKRQDPPTGAGGVIGVIFVIVLVIGLLVLLDRMKKSAALADCVVTHDPRCRALMDE